MPGDWSIALLTVLTCTVVPHSRVLADVIVKGPNNETEMTFFEAGEVFGTVPANGFQGLLVVPNHPDACKPIIGPPNSANVLHKWIALLVQDNCHLDIKVRNIRSAGYHAAILDYDLSFPDKTQILNVGNSSNDAEEDTICVFLQMDDAATLKKFYTYDKGFSVLIAPRHIFDDYKLIIIIASSFIAVIFAAVFFTIMWKWSYWKIAESNLVKRFQVFVYRTGNLHTVCTICQEDFCDGNKLVALNCNHVFHVKCLLLKLKGADQTSCPFCEIMDKSLPKNNNDTETSDTAFLLDDTCSAPYTSAAPYLWLGARPKTSIKAPNKTTANDTPTHADV